MAPISSGDRELSAYYESKPNSLEALEVMVSNLEQIQKDFQELPEEAQTLLMDFIEILKKRYSKTISPEPTAEKSPYQQFQESGFIGCVSVEENLARHEGIDRHAFMKLPTAEHQRILAPQAEAMATHYEQDTE